VAENQMVVTTGPYAIVRHPMYASSSLYVLGMPLALGSWWGFAAFALMLPFLIWRLVDEERLLARSLPGYREYQERVRYRLRPRVVRYVRAGAAGRRVRARPATPHV